MYLIQLLEGNLYIDANGNWHDDANDDLSANSGKLTPDTINQMRATLLNQAALGPTWIPSKIQAPSNALTQNVVSSLDKLMTYLLSVEGQVVEGTFRKLLDEKGQFLSYQLVLDAVGKFDDEDIRIMPSRFHRDDFERLLAVDDLFLVLATTPVDVKQTIDPTVVLVVSSIVYVESEFFKNVIEANPYRATCNYVPLFVEPSTSPHNQYRYHNYDVEQMSRMRCRFHEIVDTMRTESLCKNLS